MILTLEDRLAGTRQRLSGLAWQRGWIGDYQKARIAGPFAGYDAYRSVDTVPQTRIVHCTEGLNMYSRPFGGITSFPGHVNLNSVAANSSKAVTGISYMGEIAQKLIVAVQGKIGEDVAGTWTDRTGAASITDHQDNLVDIGYLNNTAVAAFLKKDTPLKWTGSGNWATLGGSPRSGVKGCFGWDGRMWLVSDQNLDYSAINNAESYDLTDDTVNFLDTSGAGVSPGTIITSWTPIESSVYVGLGGANAVIGRLFRVYRTGNPARPYQFEEIETGGVAPIGPKATIAAGQDLIFLSADGNVYLVRGNLFVPGGIGRNIQRTIVNDYSKSRLAFASMGVLRELGLVGLSMSLSGSTTHDRTWWYDYLNSRPGNPDYEIWHPPSTHTINAWGERKASGALQLITGGFTGFYQQQNSGSAYAGAAYTKRWTGPWHLIGDPYQAYDVLGIAVIFEPLGAFNVTLNYGVDFSASFSSGGAFSTAGGAALGTFVLGTDVLGGKEQGVAYARINATARRIRVQFENTGASQPYNILGYAFLVRPLYRGEDV